MTAKITTATTRQEFGYCAAIRYTVFLEEQKCEGGIRVEYDEYEDICEHFILYENDHPVATARSFSMSPIS